ncbi:hypothetical protein EJD97_020941 [Solanum chilense]|uniref:Uncharacterized protein n=1 Tax=Solanum chilense TaxID=4083 RepID=A0A6N2C7H2_SOLCI|nr:hypothetical protein EJD97_020941 [Solanum chilense]
MDTVRDAGLEKVEKVNFGCFRLDFVYWLLIGSGSSEMEMRRREDCGGLGSLYTGGGCCLAAERGRVFG